MSYGTVGLYAGYSSRCGPARTHLPVALLTAQISSGRFTPSSSQPPAVMAPHICRRAGGIVMLAPARPADLWAKRLCMLRCGPLSNACQTYFQLEACFYECDHNMGKFRLYNNTSCQDPDGTVNMWQISNLPLSATVVDAWWSACRNDLFCTDPSGDYFNLPKDQCVKPVGSQTNTSTCRFFKDIYANSTDFINRLWSNSFTRSTDPTAFTFPTVGQVAFNSSNPNPNDAASPSIPFPPFCSVRPAVDAMIQAISDMQLYVRTGRYPIFSLPPCCPRASPLHARIRSHSPACACARHSAAHFRRSSAVSTAARTRACAGPEHAQVRRHGLCGPGLWQEPHRRVCVQLDGVPRFPGAGAVDGGAATVVAAGCSLRPESCHACWGLARSGGGRRSVRADGSLIGVLGIRRHSRGWPGLEGGGRLQARGACPAARGTAAAAHSHGCAARALPRRCIIGRSS